MTKDQILTKVIKKLYGRTVQVDFDTEGISVTEKLGKDGFHNWCIDYADKGYYGLIFSHDFAKALWGEEIMEPGDYEETTLYVWQYHLGKMAREEEPLEYIAKFL